MKYLWWGVAVVNGVIITAVLLAVLGSYSALNALIDATYGVW